MKFKLYPGMISDRRIRFYHERHMGEGAAIFVAAPRAGLRLPRSPRCSCASPVVRRSGCRRRSLVFSDGALRPPYCRSAPRRVERPRNAI